MCHAVAGPEGDVAFRGPSAGEHRDPHGVQRPVELLLVLEQRPESARSPRGSGLRSGSRTPAASGCVRDRPGRTPCRARTRRGVRPQPPASLACQPMRAASPRRRSHPPDASTWRRRGSAPAAPRAWRRGASRYRSTNVDRFSRQRSPAKYRSVTSIVNDEPHRSAASFARTSRCTTLCSASAQPTRTPGREDLRHGAEVDHVLGVHGAQAGQRFAVEPQQPVRVVLDDRDAGLAAQRDELLPASGATSSRRPGCRSSARCRRTSGAPRGRAPPRAGRRSCRPRRGRSAGSGARRRRTPSARRRTRAPPPRSGRRGR